MVPLHAHRPPAPPPAADEAARTSGAAGAGGARARRASNAREAHDGWTFVVIPPGAGARPRTLRVSVRRLRVAFAALITITGTAVVSGGLLAVLLSIAPKVQSEDAGVELGVLADLTPSVAVPLEDDALAAIAEAAGPPVGPAGGAGATPRAPDAARPAKPIAPVTEARSAANARRRVIAPPSIMGREQQDASVSTADVTGLPVIGRITSNFANARRHPLLGVVRRHNGVDIAAASGTPITAPAPGRVIFSGRKFGFGNVVEIDHGHGVITRYAHARTLKVKSGAEVRAGMTIATVGRTGLASGPHLHFEVIVHGTSVDPLKRPLSSLLPQPEAPAPAPAALEGEVATPGADSTATSVQADSGAVTAGPTLPSADVP